VNTNLKQISYAPVSGVASCITTDELSNRGCSYPMQVMLPERFPFSQFNSYVIKSG